MNVLIKKMSKSLVSGYVSTKLDLIPKLLWKMAHVSISFTEREELYNSVGHYLTKHVIIERLSTNLIHSGEVVGASSRAARERVRGLIYNTIEIGSGMHYGFFNKKPLIVEKKVSHKEGERAVIHLSFIGGTKETVSDFVNKVKEYHDGEKRGEPGIEVHTLDHESFNSINFTRLRKLPLRDLSTVVYSGNILQEAIKFIEKFEESRAFNLEHGLPNRTGILFYGPPGTGKSSFIHVLASHFRRDILYLNMEELTPRAPLSRMLAKHDLRKFFVVAEDLDAQRLGSTEIRSTTGELPAKNDIAAHFKRNQEMSLSSLLNTLDGLISPNDLIMFATTNHIDHLDPALIRPGRFDLRLEVGLLGKSEFYRLAPELGFNPEEYGLNEFIPMAGADIRGLLLKGGISLIMEEQIKRQSSL